ncbi:hypothetical protein Emtol_0794 [Emticicia oligotrophica DSM 17448]|uniref:Uncharacterized protein n=1 Tax=Emticicia oligotrophica (strain DSM 17448 / CIP 109782 / MTCC 6937 / GPTSA100-15) TaxID=929562 RepID=A0ABN4ACH5_EMTOG|nr:hypothetical protein [Emticicia oligotrophica]AFK01945.1 hypothetical protein Emtol_0794 [Emticicia oligotrophica DSM 17448]
MRKLMIMAVLVASAIVANAQRGYDNRAERNDYERRERNDNYGRGGYDRIDSYQREARRQIAWGIETGRITSRESKRLLREVERIEYKENRYKRDGVLDPRERRDLVEDLAVLNRWINREKRDGDRVTYDDFRNSRERYDDRYSRRY